jgi:Amino acid permease
MLAVPKSEQDQPSSDMVTSFFQRVFGKTVASEVLYALVAFSSLGNVVVQSFTAARVKQEIAKEGILPWSTYFGRNFDLRLFRRGERTNSWAHAGETPAAAFALHWVFSVLLILASIPQKPQDAYSTSVILYSFTVDALFGFLVGLGLLYLRLFEAHTKWSTKSTSTPWLSISAAVIFTLGNLFPLVGIWIQPGAGSSIVPTVKWFVPGTIGMGLIIAGFLWWLGLYFVLPRIRGMGLEVEKEEVLDNGNGYWIMWHEIVRFNWVAR